MALTTLNLSGIKAGDSLNISVSQSGLTAGPYSVGSWGGGGAGGTVTMSTVHRSLRQIAPDSVRFELDFSSATFDTAGPTGSEIYDARLHDLIYLWDLDDPGTWTAPENVLAGWKNRSTAKGPFVKHLYRDPGTYTASVLIIEPSSGKTATASVTFDVGDPQDFYGDVNTIYVNNVGDSDFSDVPAGVPSGNKINIDTLKKDHNGSAFVKDATWEAFDGGHAKRWRFKRGGSWEVSVYFSSTDTPDVMFDDYGDAGEADPILHIWTDPVGGENQIFRAGYNHDQTSGRNRTETPPEFRFRNLRFQGRFDATAQYAKDPARETSSAFFFGGCTHDMTIVDCSFDGMGASVIYLAAGAGTDHTGASKFHIDNSSLTNFGGEYQIMLTNTTNPRSSAALTGVRWENPGDAVSTDPGYVGSRSCVRFGSMPFVHMRGNDSFTQEDLLTHFQIAKTSQFDGIVVNIHSCSAEGGGAFFDTDGTYQLTPQERMHAHNMVVDGVIYVATYNSKVFASLKSTGVTIRNCLAIWPQLPKLDNGCEGFVSLEEKNDTGSALPSFVADAPVKVYNNTHRMDRLMSQNSSGNSLVPSIFAPLETHPNLTAVSEENNIRHFPNLIAFPNTTEVNAEHIAFAPLTEVKLWDARNLGYRNPATLVLDTTRATPAGAIMDSKPGTDSAALNGATAGARGFFDVTGASRYGAGVYDEGTIDKGPWQVS